MVKENEKIITKLELMGCSKNNIWIIKTVDFEIYNSQYNIITTDDTDKVIKGERVGISIKWYADQIKKYYKNKFKSMLLSKATGNDTVLGYKVMVTLLDRIKINGANGSDILDDTAWEGVLRNYRIDNYGIDCIAVIVEYLSRLKFVIDMLIQYDTGRSVSWETSVPVSQRDRHTYKDRYSLDVYLDGGMVNWIEINNVGGDYEDSVFYIKELNIHNKDEITSINNCYIKEVEYRKYYPGNITLEYVTDKYGQDLLELKLYE